MKNLESEQKISAAVESLLFIYGEPLEIKKIAKILKSDEAKINDALSRLKNLYAETERGLTIVEGNGKVQMASKPEFSGILEEFAKQEFKEEITPAVAETLAFIAYLGPLSRTQIDYYRGVNSSFILRNAMLRGLVERFPDSKRKNVFLYQISFDLLKYMGISKIEELPEYEKFRSFAQKPNVSPDNPVNDSLKTD